MTFPNRKTWILAVATVFACTANDRRQGTFGTGWDATSSASSNVESETSGDLSSRTDDAGEVGGDPITGSPEGGVDSGSGTVTTDAMGDSGAHDGGPKFDTPSGHTSSVSGEGGNPKEGCKKIDFLFVIDNSSSMMQHQAKLVSNFGPFIDTIVSEVSAQDYQVMVVDSDSHVDLNYVDGLTCDQKLGATHVAACNVPNGRYLTSDLDVATLKSSFPCIANVGTAGASAEMPMTAMVTAVTTHVQPGGCNEGFLRSDAVLVVTVISDDRPNAGDDNSNIVGSPQEWYDGVVSAKAGKVEHVVVAGIVFTGTTLGGIPFPPTQRFIDFVEMFGARGVVGSTDAPDYNVFFQEAVSLIDIACNEFEPEG